MGQDIQASGRCETTWAEDIQALEAVLIGHMEAI